MLLKNLLKSFSLLGVSVLCFSSESAELPKKWYGSQKFLSCGNNKIEIVTTCSGGEGVDEFCFKQNITFGSSDGKLRRNFNIEYYSYKPSEMIVEAECIKLENRSYIVLEGTNYGNCDGCEWLDFFETDGRYLGSTPNISKNKSIKRFDIYRKSPILAKKIISKLEKKEITESFSIKRVE